MKAEVFALLFGFTLGSYASNLPSSGTPTPPSQNNSPVVEVSPYAVTERGPNHRIWQRVTAQTNTLGETIYRTNSFTELCTGLHYWDGSQWVESSAQFQITPNGAAATTGQHQVALAADLNTAVAVDLTAPDGQHLKSHVLGLAYYDSATSNNVLFAEVQNRIGQVLSSSNQVIYTNAFTDVEADVRYTYKKNGFEQDIILRQQPPSPAQFGLNPQTTTLQIWTEFLDTPEPAISTSYVSSPGPGQSAENRLVMEDCRLDFGIMKIERGNAALLGGDPKDGVLAPIAKHWVHLQGRTFLIEEVYLNSVAPQLQTLPPPSSSATNSAGGTGGSGASLHLRLPAPKQQAKSKQPMRFAQSNPVKRTGLLLDYTMVSGSVTGQVFQSDTTYYVSGELDCYGTTTIEGGTVLKCGDGGNNVVVYSNLVCATSPYRPAIFTCTNDDSVGEILPLSNGSNGLHLNTPLWLPNGSGAVSNLFFRYSWNAFISDAEDVELWNCQFIKCDHCISPTADATNLGLHNVLISMDDSINNSGNYCGCAPGALTIYSSAIHVSGEHVTADLGSQDFILYFEYASYYTNATTFAFTNSIIITPNLNPQYQYGLPPPMTVATNTTFYASTLPSGLFQTVGTGTHYLADDSPYRDYGNTNINANLIAQLRQKTTYPPIVFAAVVLSNSSTFFPRAQRDGGGTPDLGYHYDPIDYAFGSVFVTNAVLTVTPGTVIAGFGTNNTGYSLAIQAGGQFLCQGTPTSLCRIVNYDTVQEESNTNWPTAGIALLVPEFSGYSPASIIDCRFIDFSILAQDTAHVYESSGNSAPLNFQDCQFHGGSLYCALGENLTNCLLERVNSTLTTSGNLRNCLFWQGSLSAGRTFSGIIQDNMFDRTKIIDHGGYTYGYNGFNTNSTNNNLLSLTTNTIDVITNTSSYQTSWLGAYYLPTNSPLMHVGDTNANLLGLYQYTTQTNQTKEGTNRVTIGYHYVAVNSSGQPDDTDGDGLADYFEDSNGNGTFDTGETDWQTSNVYDLNGLPIAWYLQQGLNPNTTSIAGQDPDMDGLVNGQEYLYGTKPLVPEGTNIWVSTPAGFSGIP